MQKHASTVGTYSFEKIFSLKRLTIELFPTKESPTKTYLKN